MSSSRAILSLGCEPVDSLWGRESLSASLRNEYLPQQKEELASSSYLPSLLFLLSTMALILFSRGVISSLKTLLNSFFNFRALVGLEESLSWVTERDLTALLITLMPISLISLKLKSATLFLLLISLFGAYWLLKTLTLRLIGWLLNSSLPFRLIIKMGYNHLIFAFLVTIPILLLSLLLNNLELLQIAKLLIIPYIALTLLYYFRLFQILHSHSFSHFFYILYLCTVEVLPLALLTNLSLSYI